VRFQVTPRADRLPDDRREAIKANPGFGNHFSDHMLTCWWRAGEGWGPAEVVPFGDLSISPAAMGIHYGQAIFEGLKVYAREDGSHALFRADRNAARMQASAHRMAMPEPPAELFVGGCALLAAVDRDWIPSGYGTSLYLRPYMFATEQNIGVRPSDEYLFGIITCPAAPIFSVDPVPVTIRVETEDVRAAVGGTGEAKFAGNYAAALRGHMKAREAGFDQVLWLDAKEHRWIEELNGMNVFFVWDEGGRTRVTTPPLTGTILRGVTRDAILAVASDMVDEVAEEPTTVDDVREGCSSGRLREAFACGTAAVVAPIGRMVAGDDVITVAGAQAGPLTLGIRSTLLDVQHGRTPDPRGWMRSVDEILDELAIADLAPATERSLVT
jgi:branched-chain amino acid aminotransferase